MANIRAKKGLKKKKREKKKKAVKELPLFKRGCRGRIQKKSCMRIPCEVSHALAELQKIIAEIVMCCGE